MHYSKLISKTASLAIYAALLTTSLYCTKTIKVKVPVFVRECVEESPPEWKPILFEKCNNFEACLTKENASKLLRYLSLTPVYMNDWYSACGKK